MYSKALINHQGSKVNKYQKITSAHSLGAIGRACNVSREAARQWNNKGKLPDTEYLPVGHARRTNHAENIAKLIGCEPSELL